MSALPAMQAASRPISVRLHDGEPMTDIFAAGEIVQFVRASFDGAINDDSPFESVDDAYESITLQLRHRYPSLTVAQIESAGMYIALEFNRRRDNNAESAGDDRASSFDAEEITASRAHSVAWGEHVETHRR
jgi:hypothetical protein